LFCTTQLTQPIPSNDGCESFADDNDDGVCYQIGATAENWQEAQLICRSFGADLASIHNKKENDFVRRLAISKEEVKGVFLGGKVSGKGNKFGWIDGSEWDYDNFYPVDGLGDCLALDTQVVSGQWANTDCSSQLSVACIRQQNYSTPACSSGPWKEGDIILLLEANSCCDHLIIFDNYIAGNVIANLTGEIKDKVYKSST
ncbi:hypothetical protein PENTCL1PPCAC_21194, partial [Pristionchus entomophagus]